MQPEASLFFYINTAQYLALKLYVPKAHTPASQSGNTFTLIFEPHCPLPRLTAGTELRFICCGWFMGDAARAPIGACDICALGRAMWLNWFIPMEKGEQWHSAIRRNTFNAPWWAVSMFCIMSFHRYQGLSDFAGYRMWDAAHNNF